MHINKSPADFIALNEEQEKTSLVLQGDWTIHNTVVIERAIDDAKQKLSNLHLSSTAIRDRMDLLDTSGALLLKRLLVEIRLQPRLKSLTRLFWIFCQRFPNASYLHK